MKAPVGNTCPDIDKIINECKGYITVLTGVEKYSSDENSKSDAYNVKWGLDDTIDRMEAVRKANAELREWGYQMSNDAEYFEKELLSSKDKIRELNAEITNLKEQIKRQKGRKRLRSTSRRKPRG